MYDLLNKTLILRLSSIGDIVLASPLIRVLRKRFPQARIDFVVKSEYGELVRYNPYLTSVYEFSSAGGFSGLRSLRRRLRSVGYDAVIDIHDNIRSRYLRSFLRAGKPFVIDKRFLPRLMLVRFKQNRYRGVVSVSDRYIEPLKMLGVENDGEGPELFFPTEVTERMAEFWRTQNGNTGRRAIALVHGAKHKTKMWVADGFAELGAAIIRGGDSVVLVGGPDDRDRSASLKKKMTALGADPSRLIDCAGRFGLLETAALFDRCAAVVTNDSGLMHIASARRRPVVAIFGPTVREFGFFPIGTKSVVLEREMLQCRPCSYHGGSECPKGHFRCMKEISAEQVYQSLHTLLAS